MLLTPGLRDAANSRAQEGLAAGVHPYLALPYLAQPSMSPGPHQPVPALDSSSPGPHELLHGAACARACLAPALGPTSQYEGMRRWEVGATRTCVARRPRVGVDAAKAMLAPMPPRPCLHRCRQGHAIHGGGERRLCAYVQPETWGEARVCAYREVGREARVS